MDINEIRVGQRVKAFHPRKFGVIDEGTVTCKRNGSVWVNFGQKRSFRVPLSHIVEQVATPKGRSCIVQERLNRAACNDYIGKALCPFCKSETFEDIGDYQFAEDSFYHSVRCGECLKEWSVIYRAVGILADNTDADAVYRSAKHELFASTSHEV